tara:strand:- start:828 stop:2726 length:1899 start_codon:yes stop_codon:yes gene_type:complete
MPARFVGVNSTFDEQRLAINDLATDLFALQNETAVDYASVAGVATYANFAGFSTFTPLAGVATYSSVSGYSTTSGYAAVAGIATNATISVLSGYATTAGVATEAGYATAAGFADTSTYGTFAYYSQIAGFATAAQDSVTADLADSVRVTAQNTGTNYITFVNVLGNGTYQNVWTDTELKYEPATNSLYAGIISATSLSGDGSGLFNVSSEVVGVSTQETSGFNRLDVTGVSTFVSNVNLLSDSAKFIAGAGSDLEIYHNGNNYIDATEGNLYLRTTGGVSVNRDIYLRANNNLYLQSGGSAPGIKLNSGAATEIHHGGGLGKKFETTGAGVSVTGELNVSGISSFSGDVSFASTVRIPDETKLLIGYANAGFSTIGGSGGLEISHDASGTSNIVHKSNDNSLFIQGSQIEFRTTILSERYCDMIRNGPVNLYYDSVKKFETAGSGVTVTGTVYADDFYTAGIATANEFRLDTYGVTSYTRIGGGQVLASGVNDKGSVQVGALTTVFSMGHAPFNHNCYFSQTGENDWAFWTSLTKISMTVNGGISTRPHSVTVNELYVDTNANVAGVTTFQGETNFDGNINSPINVVGVTTSTFAGDVEVSTTSSGVVLTAPNGTKYRLKVDNIGNLSTEAV